MLFVTILLLHIKRENENIPVIYGKIHFHLITHQCYIVHQRGGAEQAAARFTFDWEARKTNAKECL